MTDSVEQQNPRFVSERVTALRLSAIKEMVMRSANVEDVASLAWGVPSFRTPAYIRGAVTEQLDTDADIGKYALPDGLPLLKQLAARRHHEYTGIEVDADDNVMITAGNMQGMSSLLHVITSPGDEIILTDPGFASHTQQISLCGGVPVYWPLDEDNDWHLDVDLLPGLITERTKALILVSPSNPTGKIFSRERLLRIGEIAKRHGLLIILDDPYSCFTYENRDTFFNLASVPELFDHVAYLFSFSKAYAMGGWRLGYMVLPGALKRQLIKVHDLNMICTPRVSQVAGIAALSGDAHHIAEFEARFAARRELICERLDTLAHVFGYNKPEGAYYVFPRIRAAHDNAREFCFDLLDRSKVALTPGCAFGPSGEHHVRMAFCVAEDVIDRAFDRIESRYGRA